MMELDKIDWREKDKLRNDDGNWDDVLNTVKGRTNDSEVKRRCVSLHSPSEINGFVSNSSSFVVPHIEFNGLYFSSDCHFKVKSSRSRKCTSNSRRE